MKFAFVLYFTYIARAIDFDDPDYDFLPSSGVTEDGIPCREKICYTCKVISVDRQKYKSFRKLVSMCTKLWQIDNCCQVYAETFGGMIAPMWNLPKPQQCVTVSKDLPSENIDSYFDKIIIGCPTVLVDDIL